MTSLDRQDQLIAPRLSGSLSEIRLVTRAYLAAILMLAPLVVYLWIVPTSPNFDSLHAVVNRLAPCYMIAVLILLAYWVLKRMPDALYSGIFWFPVGAAVFFAFGPLVEVFGNEFTQASLNSTKLAVNESELLRAHKLSQTGVLFTLMGFWTYLTVRPRATGPSEQPGRIPGNLVQLGMAFVFFGAIFNYAIVLPEQWGLLGITIPGALSGLGNLIDIGFAILAFCIASGNRSVRPIFWTLWPMHVLLSLLTFNKTAVIISMVVPLIGSFLAHHKRHRLIAGLVIIGAVFVSYQPLSQYGRGVIYYTSGSINEAGYEKRASIIGAYLSGRAQVSDPTATERQGWWTRLSYVGPQARAMALYDGGNSSRVLKDAWMFFVPRAIWPDKPIMTGPGLEFYRQVTGRSSGQSFLGLSIYGDLYWQGGWVGVTLGSFLVGWLFAIISGNSVRAMRKRDFLMMPAVLMGLEMTLLGPTKFILNGVIGPLPIYLAYLLVSHWVSRTARAKLS